MILWSKPLLRGLIEAAEKSPNEKTMQLLLQATSRRPFLKLSPLASVYFLLSFSNPSSSCETDY